MKKTHIYGAVAAAMLLAPVTAQALAKEGELPDPAAAIQEGEEVIVIDTTAAEKTAADKGNQEKNLDLDPVKTSASYTGTMSTTPEIDAKEVQSLEASRFQYGTGTEEDPYQVSSAGELDAVRYDLNAHYVQTGNIDLSGVEWMPFGMETETQSTQSFTGVFDGADYAISHLQIKESQYKVPDEFYGLFAKNEGILKNIRLLDVDVDLDMANMPWNKQEEDESVKLAVGSLTGWNEGTIENCEVSGSIDVYVSNWSYDGMDHYAMQHGGNIGGIAGRTESATPISNCTNYTNISVDSRQSLDVAPMATGKYIGGIAGYATCSLLNGKADHTVIRDCVNSGSITVNHLIGVYTGGIAGHCTGKVANVINYGNLDLEFLLAGNAAGSVIGFLGNTKNMNTQEKVISSVVRAINFGNMKLIGSSASFSLMSGISSVNGMVGFTEQSSILANLYNLGQELNTYVRTQNGSLEENSENAAYIKRIVLLWAVESPNQMTNAFASSDFSINGKAVTEQTQTNEDNGLSVERDQLIKMVKEQWPDLLIVRPGEPLDSPDVPILKATFTEDGYQVNAETKEDLRGLQIIIDEAEADNNFGLSSDYQTIGYDIHFENEEGKEVSRNGKFTVRIPIPENFMGKEVRLFHKENKDSIATELQFKIIDGKYYEFETTSFSWFIVASQNANKKPTTPADEANEPQEKPAQPDTKPTANAGQTIKVVPLKAAQAKQADDNTDTKTSPDTGIAIHKTSSLFVSLLGMIGLGFLTGKKRRL